MSTLTTTETPALLTVGEAATLLRVSRPTIYRRIADGTIAAARLGALGTLRIPRGELERLLGGGEGRTR